MSKQKRTDACVKCGDMEVTPCAYRGLSYLDSSILDATETVHAVMTFRIRSIPVSVTRIGRSYPVGAKQFYNNIRGHLMLSSTTWLSSTSVNRGMGIKIIFTDFSIY